jgi:CHASE3 domain sensor protein
MLAAAMSDNPHQTQGLLQLRQALDVRIANIDDLVRVEGAGQHPEAVALIRSDKGEQLMMAVQTTNSVAWRT